MFLFRKKEGKHKATEMKSFTIGEKHPGNRQG
ncbi:hypothetical protein JOC36_000134 [Weissella uvarum]|nr:hypothetical protein [Weissella uvarum]